MKDQGDRQSSSWLESKQTLLTSEHIQCCQEVCKKGDRDKCLRHGGKHGGIIVDRNQMGRISMHWLCAALCAAESTWKELPPSAQAGQQALAGTMQQPHPAPGRPHLCLPSTPALHCIRHSRHVCLGPCTAVLKACCLSRLQLQAYSLQTLCSMGISDSTVQLQA